MSSSRGNQRSQSSRSNGQGNGNGQERGSPPVWSRKLWTGSANVEVAVFEKMVQGDNGEFQTFNISAKRTYKDGDDYKSTQGFRSDDVPHLVSLLLQAHAYVSEQMNRE